jgi:hypothetical protein
MTSSQIAPPAVEKPDFPAIFAALMGYPPLRLQTRLFDRLARRCAAGVRHPKRGVKTPGRLPADQERLVRGARSISRNGWAYLI